VVTKQSKFHCLKEKFPEQHVDSWAVSFTAMCIFDDHSNSAIFDGTVSNIHAWKWSCCHYRLVDVRAFQIWMRYIFQLCVGSIWCRVADVSLCSLSVSSSLTFSWLELLHLAAPASCISACATVLNVVWWRLLLLLMQTTEEKVAVLQCDRSSVMRQNCSRFVGLC